MRIEIGKRYKNRAGEIVEVVDVTGSDHFPWLVKIVGTTDTYNVAPKGDYWGDGDDSRYDLIEELAPPINTTPIDQVTFAQLQRGVDRLWDSFRYR